MTDSPFDLKKSVSSSVSGLFRDSRSLNSLIIIALIIIAAAPLSAWDYSEDSVDFEARVAIMAAAGKWNPYFEARGVYHGDNGEIRYNSYTIGSYFRALPWMKIGAFYRLQGGARHLEDWIVVDNPGPTPDEHWWADTVGRYESLMLLDASPRVLLPWMPGGDWLLSLKTRYGYNFRNDEQTLLARPGLTWVWMSDREPLLNLSLQYPLYFALNFGDQPLYGHGPYFTALYHLNAQFKIEGRVQYLMKTYAKTEFGGLWTLDSRHLVFGLGLLYTPRFGK